jgi:hypothetical protein
MGPGIYPHYHFSIVIYTLFKNYGIENFRKQFLASPMAVLRYLMGYFIDNKEK